MKTSYFVFFIAILLSISFTQKLFGQQNNRTISGNSQSRIIEKNDSHLNDTNTSVMKDSINIKEIERKKKIIKRWIFVLSSVCFLLFMGGIGLRVFAS